MPRKASDPLLQVSGIEAEDHLPFSNILSLSWCRTIRKMDSMFCPSCGNSTLRRVSISVDDKGQTIEAKLPPPTNTRGTKVGRVGE